MPSITQTLKNIKNDEVRETSLNFQSAYDSILQESRQKDQDIFQVAQDVYDTAVKDIEELKKANETAAIAQQSRDSSLALANTRRLWLSDDIAWQQLIETRQAWREQLANIRADETKNRQIAESNLKAARDQERAAERNDIINTQLNPLATAQAQVSWIDGEERADARGIASEIRWEERALRLLDAETQASIDQRSAELDKIASLQTWWFNLVDDLFWEGWDNVFRGIPKWYQPVAQNLDWSVVVQNTSTWEQRTIQTWWDSWWFAWDLLESSSLWDITWYWSPLWANWLDVDLQVGDPVPSPVTWEVVRAADWRNWWFGNVVVVRDSDWVEHQLAHLEQSLVSIWDIVTRWQNIALWWKTWNVIALPWWDWSHLDYTVYINWEPQTPELAESYLRWSKKKSNSTSIIDSPDWLKEFISQNPNEASLKNNNPSWITYEASSSGLRKAREDAWINFTRGTSRPSNEWWNYVGFRTPRDWLNAQRIALSRNWWNINRRLQTWVWTSEWPSYARQVLWNAWLSDDITFEELNQDERNRLQASIIQKESPAFYNAIFA